MGHAWRRTDEALALGLGAWLGTEVTEVYRPASGFSNDTAMIVAGTRRMVVRLPTLVPSFPVYDLSAQGRVMNLLADAGLPVPRPIAVVLDESWLGAPFLVMPWVDGRPIGEAPGLDPWLLASTVDQQRGVQASFLTTLAAVHRVEWAGAGVRIATNGEEVDWWVT